VDVFEDPDAIRIVAEVPGVSPEDVKISHENDVLTIRGSKARVAEKAEDFGWSSDRAYRRGRGSDWLDVDRLLSMP
jgi:HSP20 family molecular chaperone IbpA